MSDDVPSPSRAQPTAVRRRRRTLVHLASVLVVAGSLVAIIFWRRAAVRVDPALNPLAFANVSPGVKYVGDAGCTACHGGIAASYARTAMGRAWRRPTNAEPIEDYSQPHELVAESSGFHYQVFRDGDRYFQREFRVDAAGRATQSQVREVHYVLGSGTKGRSYVTSSNGFLTIMPVAWYTAAGQWDLNPGYHQDNSRFSREVIPKCIMCHTSYPAYTPLSENHYAEPVPDGIGCERCHGPGELHVRFQESRTVARPAARDDKTIVNPAKLPPDLQNDVCLQCHLTTKEGLIFLSGTQPFDFRPGQPLAKVAAHFQLAGRAGETFSAVSHGSRVARSRCFIESKRQLTCITCHDPHVPVADVPRSFFNARCTDCHGGAACRRPNEPGPESDADAHRANDCVACHMPAGRTRDIAHTVTTDHWIRKRPGAGDRPPAAFGPNDLVPLEDFCRVADAGVQGIAHAGYGGAAHRPPNLRWAVELLRQALKEKPDDPRLNYWLGYSLRHSGNYKESIEYFERALRGLRWTNARPLADEEFLSLHTELGQSYFQLGQRARAIELGEQLLREAPYYTGGYEYAAEMFIAEGRSSDALRVARLGVARNPHVARLQWILGWKLFEVEKNPAAALECLKRATELEPSEQVPFLVLAQVYDALGDAEKVIETLRGLLAAAPDFVPAQINLADVLIRRGRSEEAVPLLESVLHRLPSNAQARALMKKVSEK